MVGPIASGQANKVEMLMHLLFLYYMVIKYLQIHYSYFAANNIMGIFCIKHQPYVITNKQMLGKPGIRDTPETPVV